MEDSVRVATKGVTGVLFAREKEVPVRVAGKGLSREAERRESEKSAGHMHLNE